MDRMGVRSILGKIGFYRRFIRDYVQVTEPINNLLKEEVPFVWTSECQLAFDELKERMLQAPILVPPNWSQRFFLYILAGGKALGAVLMQQDGNGVEHAMYFAGRMLNESELKYGAVEKEIMALIYASKKLRHYLLPKLFTVFSNYNPLRYLLSKPDIKGLTGRWILLLQEYDFEVITRPRTGLRVAQGLTRTELPEERNDHVDIPDLQLLAIDVVLAWAQEVV
eukprot:Gb_25094 [translate_table: standard]